MKAVFNFLLVSLTAAVLFIACTVRTTPPIQGQKPILPESDASMKTSRPDWEMEWDKNLQAARKEGSLSLYVTFPPSLRQAIGEGFEKKTGIKAEMVTGRGDEIAAKVLMERRAGLHLADVHLGGTTTSLTQLRPGGALKPILPELFLPEVLDTRLWYKGAIPFMDKDTLIIQYRFTPGAAMMDVVFDTGKFKKSELVSWYDLLNPKFKGKMNLQDPTTAGKGGKFINKALVYFGLDWDYMRALAKQEPFIMRDLRLQIEWVVQGKSLLAVNPDSVVFEDFQNAGASIDFTIFKETKDILGGGFGAMSLAANSPHPNATKLFANWLLSKEGQTLYSTVYGVQSAREDVPTSHLPDWRVRKPGVDYPVETEEFILNEEKLRPMTIQIFGPLMK